VLREVPEGAPRDNARWRVDGALPGQRLEVLLLPNNELNPIELLEKFFQRLEIFQEIFPSEFRGVRNGESGGGRDLPERQSWLIYNNSS
jgi:hypothetical protein